MSAKNNNKRIMVFGTFDGLHPGHLNFFKQAKKIAKNSVLIVSIARDKNVKKIKGTLPLSNEKHRMNLVKKSVLVDKVVLSGLNSYLRHIVKERPDIIALGYDQNFYVKNLKKDLQNKGLVVKIVRMKSYKKNIFKNSLLKKRRRV